MLRFLTAGNSKPYLKNQGYGVHIMRHINGTTYRLRVVRDKRVYGYLIYDSMIGNRVWVVLLQLFTRVIPGKVHPVVRTTQPAEST